MRKSTGTTAVLSLSIHKHKYCVILSHDTSLLLPLSLNIGIPTTSAARSQRACYTHCSARFLCACSKLYPLFTCHTFCAAHLPLCVPSWQWPCLELPGWSCPCLLNSPHNHIKARISFASPACSAGYFLTKIFHPNVSKTGEICVNVLKRDWKSDLGLRHVLVIIR